MIAPTELQQVYSLLQQMIASPADQVAMGARLRSLVQNLPPEGGEILSRTVFDRCGLWTLVANFFDVIEESEAPVEVIRMPRDCWVRGVNAFALVPLTEDGLDAQGLIEATTQRKALRDTTGANFLGLVELNWRINSKQGFIGSGSSEILGNGSLVAGDGFWSAPLDWRLQLDDTIEVRCRTALQRMFPTNCPEPSISRIFPWVCVAFWVEEMSQPQ